MKPAIEMEIKEELKAIHGELQYIREHMVDVDYLLTPGEEKVLDQSLEEYKKGETILLSDLKSKRK